MVLEILFSNTVVVMFIVGLSSKKNIIPVFLWGITSVEYRFCGEDEYQFWFTLHKARNGFMMVAFLGLNHGCFRGTC